MTVSAPGSTTNGTFVVIPAFDRWAQTQRCLEALKSSTCRFQPQIVVVDHGSNDETANAIARDYPEVTRLAETPSLWWAGATNRGVQWALDHHAERVVLLNNDAYLAEGALDRLLSHAEDRPGAVIAALPRDLETGTILNCRVTACFLLGFPTVTLPTIPALERSPDPLVRTRLIMGGRGVVIPRPVFQQVGLLDQRHLPHYGADHDFYLRCRQHGIPLLIARDVTVYIDGQTTTRASRIGSLTYRQFYSTLWDERSHRNVRTLSALFRKHYPIPRLYGLGVALNLLRYALTYIASRTLYLLSRR